MLSFAVCAGPSLAKIGTVDLIRGQTTYAGGEPLPGVNVTIKDGNNMTVAEGVSDSTGNFSFTNVSDGGTGRILVLVNYAEYGTTYNSTRITPAWYPSNHSVIDVSASDTSLLIYKPIDTGATAGKPFTAMGQVTDAKGDGVAGAKVTLYDGIYQVIGTTATDLGGNFNFTNVIANSPGCKVTVNYTATDGNSYHTKLVDTLWYPTDKGLIMFESKGTQLTDYFKLGDTGYVWGAIADAAGNPLNGTVYLTNSTANLSIQTYDSTGSPGFVSKVPAGNYTAYAEHVGANSSLKSRPVSIEVQPALKYLDTNAQTFIVEQVTPSATPVADHVTPTVSTPSPFNSPVILIVALIGAILAIGATDFMKKRK